MFGNEMHRNLIDEYLEDMNSDGKTFRRKYSAFNAESKTQFQAMLELNDQNLLDRFRKNEEELTSFRQKADPREPKFNYDSMDIADKFSFVVERGLLAIERRARQVVMTKVSSNLSLIEFVHELEQLLFMFTASPDESSSVAEEPVSVNAKYWTNLLHPFEFPPANNTLLLRFRSNVANAAFFRLVVHGVCQFHGLSSKSFVETKASSGEKTLKISAPKMLSRSLRDKISLGSYLFAALLVSLRDSESSPVNVPLYDAWEINNALFRSLMADVRTKLTISLEDCALSERVLLQDDGLCADFVMIDLKDFDVMVEN